jgi:hypothetical protein
MGQVGRKPASHELQVAAFTSLREEISRRSNAQLQLITISLVGFTTLASIVLGSNQQPVRYELLLLIPLLSSATGLLWLDHDRRIREIGDYLLDEVFAGASGSFEERADQLESTWTTRLLGFLVPTLAVFVGPAATSLVWTYNEQALSKAPGLWYSGVVLTVLYVSYFFWVMNSNAKARVRHTGTFTA